MNRSGVIATHPDASEDEQSSGTASGVPRTSKHRLIVISNRVTAPGTTHAGGLGQAMRTALRGRRGVWFGWSGSVRDEPLLGVAREGAVRYVTRDLSPEEHREYYVNYSNRVLWPLLHGRLDLVAYSRTALDAYFRTNAAFADAVQKIVRADDVIWIHDYHLIPLARMLRERGVTCRIGFFLHVPVPPRQTLLALPAHEEVLPALAACDLIGTQTEEDARNLRDYFASQSASRGAGAQAPKIMAFPIGIDVDAVVAAGNAAEQTDEHRKLRASLADQALLLGVDRLDYSKGLPQRLRAYDRMLRKHPELSGRVTFLQIAPPTRTAIGEYARMNRTLQRLAGRINGAHADETWHPVRYLNRSFASEELSSFYRAAKVGVVTPLRDGMNLVAKEYVASQDGNDPGVLVLSEFAGAARELNGAIKINPFDREQCADAMYAALTMPVEERRQRWRSMMIALRGNDIHGWRDAFLAELERRRGSSEEREASRMISASNAPSGIRLRTQPGYSTSLTVPHHPSAT